MDAWKWCFLLLSLMVYQIAAQDTDQPQLERESALATQAYLANWIHDFPLKEPENSSADMEHNNWYWKFKNLVLIDLLDIKKQEGLDEYVRKAKETFQMFLAWVVEHELLDDRIRRLIDNANVLLGKEDSSRDDRIIEDVLEYGDLLEKRIMFETLHARIEDRLVKLYAANSHNEPNAQQIEVLDKLVNKINEMVSRLKNTDNNNEGYLSSTESTTTSTTTTSTTQSNAQLIEVLDKLANEINEMLSRLKNTDNNKDGYLSSTESTTPDNNNDGYLSSTESTTTTTSTTTSTTQSSAQLIEIVDKLTNEINEMLSRFNIPF